MKGCLIILAFTACAACIANASNNEVRQYTLDSDRQLILPNGNVKAIGHVFAVSGKMTIDAEEAILHREIPSDIYITATGNPIKYKGITEDGKPFSGKSKKLKYTPDTGEVILTDEAVVEQDGNTITAEVITYNTITKKMVATTTPGKRVRSIIYPDKISKNKKQ